MEIRDLVLFLEAGTPCDARLALALGLAEQFGASLSTLCAPLEPPVDIADGFVIGPAAISDALERHEAEIARLMTATRTALAAALVDRKIDHAEFETPLGETPQDLAVRARFHDLAIVRRPISHDGAGHALAERIALASGTPCLIVPDKPPRTPNFARIVVGWNGSREAKRAMQDAMPLLQRAANVELLEVDGASGETPAFLAREGALRFLAHHGVTARLHRVNPQGEDAGAVLLHKCAALEADLLVMGAYGHSRTKEMVLGGATRTVLARAGLPVLLSH